MRFGCVLGDAEYGKVAKFRHALDDAGLLWALGIPPTQKVFAPGVTTLPQLSKRTGRPRKHPAHRSRARRCRPCSPTRPTLPEARRHVVAALLGHLGHCPNCGHRTPWHMLV